LGGPQFDSAAWIARWFLGATFLVSGLSKLRDTGSLEAGVRSYAVLPVAIVPRFARTLPAFELALALVLLTGLAARVSALVSLVMVLAFAYAVMVNILRGRSIPCHCFGTSRFDRIGAATVLRLAMLAGASVVVALSPTAGSVPPAGAASHAEQTLALFTSAVALTVVAFLLGPAAVLFREVSILIRSRRYQAPPTEPTRGGRRGSDGRRDLMLQDQVEQQAT
jgi:uncharacterized membrane protein YphA (DoxX/SURF4 family)